MLMCFCLACGEPEVAAAPPSIEQQLAKMADELKQNQCEIKRLEKDDEIDQDKMDELEINLKKLNKKCNDLLNKNRLSGPEIDRLIKAYLKPAVNTMDC